MFTVLPAAVSCGAWPLLYVPVQVTGVMLALQERMFKLSAMVPVPVPSSVTVSV